MISPSNFLASLILVELLPTPVGPRIMIRFFALNSNFYQKKKENNGNKD